MEQDKTPIPTIPPSPPFAIVPDGKAPVFVLPKEHRAEILDLGRIEPWLGRPTRKRGNFYFGTVESFVRYFNEHKDKNSRIFAVVCDSGAKFVGMLNFHGEEPSFNDHACHHVLQHTQEWRTWIDHNRQPMSQAEFASFLEENADLFVQPAGADLLELIQTLEAKQHVHYDSGMKLQNGTIRLRYSEEVELRGCPSGTQSGDMELPALVTASIVPFEGVSQYEVKARLKYKLDSRKVSFWYEAIAPHQIIREVVNNLLRQIEEDTGIKPFIG